MNKAAMCSCPQVGTQNVPFWLRDNLCVLWAHFPMYPNYKVQQLHSSLSLDIEGILGCRCGSTPSQKEEERDERKGEEEVDCSVVIKVISLAKKTD